MFTSWQVLAAMLRVDSRRHQCHSENRQVISEINLLWYLLIDILIAVDRLTSRQELGQALWHESKEAQGIAREALVTYPCAL